MLRDDSPEDREGGASFFPAALDIFITYTNGKTDKGRDIRFDPVVQGGLVQEGFLSADGTEEIRIRFDFDSPAFVTRSSGAKEEIKKVEFNMTIGNDYQVWMTSDRQTNDSGQPVLLLVAQAAGNVKDNTNLRVLEFEYGLPTANQIIGGTVEMNNVLGFNFYGEYDLSLAFRQLPQCHPQVAFDFLGRLGGADGTGLDDESLQGRSPLVLLRRSLQYGSALQYPDLCHALGWHHRL